MLSWAWAVRGCPDRNGPFRTGPRRDGPEALAQPYQLLLRRTPHCTLPCGHGLRLACARDQRVLSLSEPRRRYGRLRRALGRRPAVLPRPIAMIRRACAVALAQSAEHRNVDPKVTGSRPVGHPKSLEEARVAMRGLARCLLVCRGVIPRRPPRRDPSRPAALIPRPCRGVIPRRPPWSAPLSKARPPVRFHRRGDDVCAGGLSIRNDVGGLPLGALPFLIRTALRTYRPGSWRGGVARRGRVSRSPGSVRREGVAGRGRVSRSPGSVRRGGPARSGRARGAASGRRPLRRRHPSQGCRHRLIESSPGMTEPSLEEIRVFGQCGGPWHDEINSGR